MVGHCVFVNIWRLKQNNRYFADKIFKFIFFYEDCALVWWWNLNASIKFIVKRYSAFPTTYGYNLLKMTCIHEIVSIHVKLIGVEGMSHFHDRTWQGCYWGLSTSGISVVTYAMRSGMHILWGIVWILDKPPAVFNLLHTKFFIGNIKSIISFLQIDMTQEVEILFHVTQELTYSI